jgi:phosphoglycerol transferase MdoB-like AlkP superfamily enzyme
MQPGNKITEATDAEPGEEPLPPFSVQMSEQLGGVRGLVESSIPITLFILVNFLGDHFNWWSLRTSLIIAVVAALGMAGYRLIRKESTRHAFNGVFGIAIGAYIAWKSGDAKDIYLPGMFLSAGYVVGMLVSVAIGRPLVGWLWSVMLDKGATRWRDNDRLRRAFVWLTVLWGVVYALKLGVQVLLYRDSAANSDDLLGIARLALGWPPYALLAAITVWQARRILRDEAVDPAETAEPEAA